MDRWIDHSPRDLTKWTKCQPDQWSNGEFICLKGSRSTFSGYPWPAWSGRTHAASVAYRYAGWIWGCSLFPNQRRLSSDFWRLQTPAQTSGGTPAQPAGKQGPYRDVGVSNCRDWGSCLGSGWGPASGARTPTPAQPQDDCRYPNQRLYYAWCRRVFEPLQCSLSHEWSGKHWRIWSQLQRALKPVIRNLLCPWGYYQALRRCGRWSGVWWQSPHAGGISFGFDPLHHAQVWWPSQGRLGIPGANHQRI